MKYFHRSMSKTTGILRGRHCVFNLIYHLVFLAKYRRKVFTDKILKDLEEILKKIAIKQECQIVKFNGDRDHVHLILKMSS